MFTRRSCGHGKDIWGKILHTSEQDDEDGEYKVEMLEDEIEEKMRRKMRKRSMMMMKLMMLIRKMSHGMS